MHISDLMKKWHCFIFTRGCISILYYATHKEYIHTDTLIWKLKCVCMDDHTYTLIWSFSNILCFYQINARPRMHEKLAFIVNTLKCGYFGLPQRNPILTIRRQYGDMSF